MPVANRLSLRLTPVGATQPAQDYLKAQPPACSAQEASLAVFALLTVACLFCLHRLCYTRGRSTRRSAPFVSPAHHTLGKVDDDAAEQGSGPAVDDEKRRTSPDSRGDSEASMGAIKSNRVRFSDSHATRESRQLSIDPQWAKATEGGHLTFMARPPPAPPLTPPELSTAVFTFENRTHLQDSFMHQPNPDYMSSTDSPPPQSSSISPTGARRRSYNKTIPLGIAAPHNPPLGSETESAETALLSSSYPPTSALLPPPPPGLQQFDEETPPRREIEVRGEIISALDSQGAGWTRHTRVYGGGVCLACAASGGTHGGGFYGENVSPEEMHH